MLGGLGLSVLSACRRGDLSPKPTRRIARIISLTPNTTEALFAIGAGELLVGRSRYCDHPAEARRLPSVGGYIDPSLEAILALDPDLVTGARGPAGPGVVRPLEERGISTYFPPTESIDEIESMIVGLAGLVDRAEAGAGLVSDIRAERRKIADSIAGAEKPRVLLVFGTSPIVVAGPGSFPDEMLRLAGATNAITEGVAYPTLGLERILAIDPDLVINAAVAESHGSVQLASEPGWRELRAMKAGQYRAIGDEVVLRPGPRIAEGLAILTRAIHPHRAIP